MKIEMPKLAYATTALEPVISEQTINFHYGKHLQNYVNTLSSLVKDTEWDGKSVEDLVEPKPGGGGGGRPPPQAPRGRRESGPPGPGERHPPRAG